MDEIQGMKFCPRCKLAKALSEFKRRASGAPQAYCRPCHLGYWKEYYEKHKAEYVARANRHNAKMREILRAGKDKPCADCGQRFPFYVMEYDHRDDEQKLCNVSELNCHRRVSMRKLLEEIAKCDVVCANCHRIRTWRRRQCWPRKHRQKALETQSLFDGLLPESDWG